MSMKKKKEPVSARGALFLYQTEDGKTRIEVRLQDETVWLTQKLMAELFQTTKQNISLHIQNVFDEGELSPEATVKEYLTVQTEGSRQVNRPVDFYNLDMIISVGYRIKSHVATRFRQWATQRLREYIIKGFTLDDERLKEVNNIGSDYFDEMLERIRDIRSSEKRFYQKIRDIYKLAADYDPTAAETLDAFLHFNERDILTNAGKVTKEIADNLALEHYEVFNRNRLAIEAKEEAIADDEELKKIESAIERKKKQRHK